MSIPETSDGVPKAHDTVDMNCEDNNITICTFVNIDSCVRWNLREVDFYSEFLIHVFIPVMCCLFESVEAAYELHDLSL